jgi:hypothetical protein
MSNTLWRRSKSKLSVLLKNPYINALRGVPLPSATGEPAQQNIAAQLRGPGPALVGRIGASEGKIVRHYLRHRAKSETATPYPEDIRIEIKTHSGFFHDDDASLDRFARLYADAASLLTLRALWTPFDADVPSSHRASCRLLDLDPFFAANPWSAALADRRVTVISPFSQSITSQFAKRDKLFGGPVLPFFALSTVTAPQTHCEQDVAGQDWFGNVDRMVATTLEQQPDIAIIGAGAYGLPAGAALFRHGVKVVVMGGATQLLFGLRGKRWENDRAYARLMNEHWVRPSVTEQPAGFGKLEIHGGAYW